MTGGTSTNNTGKKSTNQHARVIYMYIVMPSASTGNRVNHKCYMRIYLYIKYIEKLKIVKFWVKTLLKIK